MRISPLFLLFPFLAFAQNTLPTFDGVVNPEEWSSAEKHTIEYEISPGNNTPSPVATEAYITYGVSDLYVGFIAYADMSTLRSSIRNRDEGYQDDFVMIGIDTYGDGRYMVSLGANAEGNQLDLKFLPSGNDDTSYNVSYESKASKHQDAYHVELKIPFSVLQFKNKPTVKWNILLYRSTYTADSRSQNINFPIDLNNPCLACQTPVSLTLNNIKAKNRIEFLPYVYGGLSGEREDNALKFGKFNKTIGLSGLVDLNNVTSLEYAINPDFSQVEADASRIVANNTFAIAFPERRAYFNEGNDIISSNLRTVYTRSINQPLLSTKLISQGEHDRIYWLAAYDEASPYLIGGENGSYFGEGTAAYSSIFKYQRTYKQGTNISFISTNRFFKEKGSGHIFGLSGLWRLGENITTELEINKSFTKEPNADWIDEANEDNDIISGKTVALDGENLRGDGLYLSVERNTKNWSTELEYTKISPLYQTPLGFVTQNNLESIEFEQGYQHFFKEDAFLKQMNFSLETEFRFNYQGLKKYSSIDAGAFVQFSGNVESFASYSHVLNEEFEGFNARGLDNFELFVRFNPSEKIQLRAFTSIGESIFYDDDPAVGNNFFLGTFNSFQVTSQLRISPSFRYTHLKNKEDGSFYFKGYIGRLNVNYQFNKTLSFRIIGEYNDFDEAFFYQPLFKWNPNPFTIFYIGGTNGYSRIDNQSRFSIDNSQIYMKFQYLFSL